MHSLYQPDARKTRAGGQLLSSFLMDCIIERVFLQEKHKEHEGRRRSRNWIEQTFVRFFLLRVLRV